MAIKLSRFQDQPANRITTSKQSPLNTSTARLSRISGGRRKASQSERSTKNTIGATTFHMLALTREKIARPSSSQPESQTSWRGNCDSRTWSRAVPAAPWLVAELSKPSAKSLVGVRAVTLSKIQRLVGLVGQKMPGVAL